MNFITVRKERRKMKPSEINSAESYLEFIKYHLPTLRYNWNMIAIQKFTIELRTKYGHIHITSACSSGGLYRMYDMI